MITEIEIYGEKKDAIFIKRLNRFEALAEYDGAEVLCHVANTGRIKELLVPGRDVVIRKAKNPDRKTKWDLIISHTGEGVPVFIESVMANRLIYKALNEGRLKEFEDWPDVRREVSYGNSRFDIQLTKDKHIYYIEVKSANLVYDGIAMFPDAPTVRGTKHVLELIKAKGEGFNSAIVIVSQREDARIFTPNKETDPDFAKAVAQAAKAGVKIYAYRCRVTKESITMLDRIDVNPG